MNAYTPPLASSRNLTSLTATSRTPGIQYLVVTPSEILFEHAGGWADLCRRVPVDTATTMMAYSMSKTITAVAVLQLIETGRVGLDEPVERYLGSLLPYGSSVKVRSSFATRQVSRIQFRCGGFMRQIDMRPSTKTPRSQPS